MVSVLLILLPISIAAFVWAVTWNRIREITTLIYRSYFNLAKLPGPKAYPIIGSAWQFKLDTADFMTQLNGWINIYGFYKDAPGVVKAWLGPVPLAVVVKPDFCKTVLESNTLITKATQYDKLSEWIGTGLLTSTNEKWFSRRKMLTPAFHFNILKGYSEVFIRQGEIFVDQLEKLADTGREVDLFPYFKRCAMDIICETAMASQVNAQIGKNSEYVNAVIRISDIIFTYERSPWLWFKPILYGCGLGFEFDRLVKLTTDFTRKVISERRQALIDEGGMEDFDITKNKKKMVFLDLMLYTQKQNNLSDEDIREEVDTFMFEGHDTTSSGMGFTAWLIGQHKDYQDRIHAEMDEVFGDSMREPTEADLKKCVLLEKCIKESLRLCPPVPIFARRLTHDLQLDEYTIPKDITILIPPFGTHRNPDEWEKPDQFYPEHFDSEAVSKRHPFAYFPFSAGPRNCIGQKFALAEEKIVLSYFFRKYRLETVEPAPGNRFVPELILKPQEGVLARIYKRRP